MSPLCRDRNGSCNQGTYLPCKTPALLGFVSCRRLASSCNSLLNLCWPPALVHPPHLPLCKAPGCLRTPWVQGERSRRCMAVLRPPVLGKWEAWGGKSRCCYNPHDHPLQRRGAWRLWWVSGIRPCLVISFTMCPNTREGRHCCIARASLPTRCCL